MTFESVKTQTAVADVPAAAGGSCGAVGCNSNHATLAEHNALKDKVNTLIARLEAAKVLAP